MASFEHIFEETTFKLTLTINESNGYLRFAIFDKNKYYLKTDNLPVHKKRISELIAILTKPNPLLEMRSFHFGDSNNSFLLFYTGLLIGNIRDNRTAFPKEFKVAGISGELLANYLQEAMDNNSKTISV